MLVLSRARAVAVAGALAAGLAACGQQDGANTSASVEGLAVDPAALPTLNTYITNSIQIDQLGTSALAPEDANLFVGLDPADQTLSADKPAGGPGDYIDWNDLGGAVADHVIYDFTSGKDPTSFPQSNECVAASQVLSKMDLTYVAAANNVKYAYFAVQRANNNGDAGYYWLFTKKAPRLVLGEAPCHPDQQRLLYDITVGDVLLGGHFHPNNTPLLRVFKATQALTGVTAVAAIDFTSSLWAEEANGVAAVAVNTTVTAPGAFGAQGVIAMSGANLAPEIFAEAAVPTAIFTGGAPCGAKFYGSVITRSSGSGGTSPDLKDLAGPALFNFGEATATARLTPSCNAEFGYELLSFTGLDSTPVTPTCAWTFDNGGGTSGSCSGMQAAAPGTYKGTLVATDPVSGCAATVTTAPVNVYGPMSVTANMTPTCQMVFSYAAGAVTGGSGSFSHAWSFSGPGAVTPASSTAPSGNASVSVGAVSYDGHLVVTDLRQDLAGCQAEAMASAKPYGPIVVSIAPVAPVPACPSMSSDAVTYVASAAGGSGNYAYAWNLPCAGATCTVDPPDGAFCFAQDLFVTVSDDSALCPAVPSETETVTKITILTATNN